MAYTFTKYSAGGASVEEVVQIVKTNFEGGVGYEESGEAEIVSEQTITVPDADPFIFPSYLPLTVGNTYTVNFDGTLYECVATATTNEFMGDVIYLGNAGMMGMTPETSEPFFLMNIISASMSGLLASGGERIFSLSGYATVTRQIDPKYLNTIGKAGTGMNAEVFNGNAAENASGAYSHAEGGIATASGDFSHAEGWESTASGEASHAEGSLTTASNDNAHAEGSDTVASGRCSHTEGFHTIASGRYQHVQGQYNIEDTADKYAHIVGNGNATNGRSNAHTLDWDGNAWFAGKVKVGGTGYDDPNAVEIGAGGSGGSGGIQMLKQSCANASEIFSFVTANATKIFKVRLDTIIGAYIFPSVSTNGLGDGAIIASCISNGTANPENDLSIAVETLHVNEGANKLMFYVAILASDTSGEAPTWHPDLVLDLTDNDTFAEYITGATFYYLSE